MDFDLDSHLDKVYSTYPEADNRPVIGITSNFVNGDAERGYFNLQLDLWLWFTVLFANFAEAVAEGRGKAQAQSLRLHAQLPVPRGQ